MKVLLFLFLGVVLASNMVAQVPRDETNNNLRIAFNIGLGVSYTDKYVLINSATSIDFDFTLSDNYFLQFAPKYTYLHKWIEHYITLPIHFGVNLTNKIRIAAGPALSFDVGNFKDIGISAGMYYHFSERSAISISAFSFTLYDYKIDYLFIPLAVSYNLMIFK